MMKFVVPRGQTGLRKGWKECDMEEGETKNLGKKVHIRQFP